MQAVNHPLKDNAMKYFLSTLVLSTLSLSACTTQNGEFPSLSKRSIEDQVVADTTTDPITVMQNLPAPIQRSLSAALNQSRTAHATFLQDLPVVRQSISAAAGAKPASESWVVAQMQLSSLEMGRSPSVSALADIDALYISQLNAELESDQTGGASIIAQARDQVSAQVDAQQLEIDKIKSGLQ